MKPHSALAVAAVAMVVACQVASSTAMTPPSSAGEQLPISEFGDNLFAAVAKVSPSDSGVFLSPFSIAQALGMLFNGAEPGSKSYSQLQSVVFGGLAGNETQLGDINSAMADLAAALAPPADGNLIFENANSVWLARCYELQQEFAEAVAEYYLAQVEPITTADVINSWVSNATMGKITEIVDDAALQGLNVMLINALYFKGIWEKKFDKESTSPAPFQQLSGKTNDVAMMSETFDNSDPAQVSRFVAQSNTDNAANVSCVAVKLGFKGGSYSAVLAMPNGTVTEPGAGPLRLVSPNMDYSEALAACRGQLVAGLADPKFFPPLRSDLTLKVPRFEVEYSTSLRKPLLELGITGPFAGGDLTRMATFDGVPSESQVDDILHKVYFKMDENGAEGAAVTAASSRAFTQPEVILYDRPLAVAVVHEGTSTVLFQGEVLTPEAWQEPR